MKTIYKTISLEQFKCRTPNTLVGFKDGNYLIPQIDNFFVEFPNGNYNSCPSDIILPLNFTDNKRTYNFSAVTDVLSTSINLIKSRPYSMLDYPHIHDYGDNSINHTPDGIEYYKTIVKPYQVSTDGGTTWNRYLSYRKLHKWFIFFKDYFNLLNTTSCKDSEKVFKSALDYYYSNTEKNESIDYYQKLDEIFISRGGVISTSDDELTYCDLYDWMRDYIFLEYNIETESVQLEDGTIVSLKQFAKEWKTTRLNIVSLQNWYKWFGAKYELYSGVTDCKTMDYDDSEFTDCCDCEEYKRLGGDAMYFFLKNCIEDYESKITIMRDYCTNTATINIQIPITVGNNNIGEGSALVEDWEGGVDYFPNTYYMDPVTGKYLGTTIHYGGSSFHREDSNEIITVQDSVFVSSKFPQHKDYPFGYLKVTNHNETKKGYIYNKYKELGFIVNGQNIYSEYLPAYINDHKEDFQIQHSEKITSYSYSDYDFVINPSAETMSTNYNITSPSGRTHYFYIDGNIYESEFHKTLYNYDKIEVSGTVNPIFVEYIKKENISTPYVVYQGQTYFGYYIKDEKTQKSSFQFTFKKIPKHDWDWFTISEEESEFVFYNDVYYRVINGKITIEYNNIIKTSMIGSEVYTETGDKITFAYIDGYILNSIIHSRTSIEESVLAIIKKINGTYYCVENVLNGTEYEFIATSGTSFCNVILDISQWDNTTRGYWITNDTDGFVLHFIKPYTIYKYGYVKGSVRSRLSELEDTSKTFDKLGNEMGGLYCGNKIHPTDNEILDFYFHVGNTTNLSHIIQEGTGTTGTTAVYKVNGQEVLNEKTDYYWGNVISGIRFYFKDDNGDIINNTKVKPINVDTMFQTKPTKKMKVINNIDYVKKCLKEFVKGYCLNCGTSSIETLKGVHIGDLVFSGTDTTYKILKVIEVVTEWDGSDSSKSYKKITHYEELTNIKEQIDALPRPMYCEISYNVGAIIQRPWKRNYEEDNNDYHYRPYNVTTNYHKGVEYSEELIVGTNTCTYYSDKKHYYNVNYLTLEPTEIVTYYLDDNPDEFSIEFSANTAHFIMETNANVVDGASSMKYTKEINSSLSDGRKFNFYNGLMAAPTIVENYNIGTTSLRNVNEDIYVDRGVNYAYDKHLKLLEIKTLEALEEYGNGFFKITDNNNSGE